MRTKRLRERSQLSGNLHDSWQLIRSMTNKAAMESIEARTTNLAVALRWHETSTLENWGEKALLEIQRNYPELRLMQSTLFARQEANDKPYLKQIGGLALPTDTPRSLRWTEGLVGQVAKTQRVITFATDTDTRGPESSFFRLRGQTLNIVPLVYNDRTVGVWEYLSMVAKGHLPVDIQNKVATTLATQLAGALSQERISALLLEAQQKNQALELKEADLQLKLDELNKAQKKLELVQKDLERSNENLEENVMERTRELEAAMQHLQSTQSQLIAAEKMASLGQLIAGVAHEINTPIGAVKAAGTNIMDILPALLDQGSTLIPHLPNEAREQTTAILKAFLANTVILSAKEERAKKRAYSKALQAEGYEDCYSIVDSLIAAGFYADPSPYMPLLTGPSGEQILQYLAGQGQLIRNLRNILLAANKTAKVVYALKSYSHSHEADETSKVNLMETIETVLILYHNQLKRGVEVTTDLVEVPAVKGNPDELSQVWTNIIHNAVQAMDHKGHLHVKLRDEGEFAQIQISDNGKGIPQDIQEKIFEPFFTTKRRGEGTGLGLDICRKIVEKHKGRIYVKSQPGETIFFIELPYPMA